MDVNSECYNLHCGLQISVGVYDLDFFFAFENLDIYLCSLPLIIFINDLSFTDKNKMIISWKKK